MEASLLPEVPLVGDFRRQNGPGYGMQDYWVVKIDALGNILWDMTLRRLKNDNCKSIDATLMVVILLVVIHFPNEW
ncbi:MAG: hypothetical protein IPO47_19470 [Bacteroidetes bacterium]|nr:hypothetical protein [Bacteroidota bacterium]